MRSCPTLITASAAQQEDNNDTVSARAPQRRESWNRCTCPYRSRSTFVPWETSMAASQRVCPFHKNDQKLVLFSKRWIINNRILKFSVSASLTIRKAAEGVSISPNLQFRPVVASESPVFCLLRETETNLKSRMAGIELERAQRKLLRIFMNGEGSYLDTLPNGNTILHVSFFPWQGKLSFIWLVYMWTSTPFLTNKSGDKPMASIQPYLG